jgi:hypothetical protein
VIYDIAIALINTKLVKLLKDLLVLLKIEYIRYYRQAFSLPY